MVSDEIMIAKSGIRNSCIGRGLSALRVLLLVFSFVLSFNSVVTAEEAGQHAILPATSVAHMPGSLSADHDGSFCLLCHVGCHCQIALPWNETVSVLNRPTRRVVFDMNAKALSSAELSRAIKPPRPV